MGKSTARLRIYIGWLAASALLVVAACFVVNCLVDPLWYLRGNVLTGINYPFNERLAKVNRFLPRIQDYDCIIFGTSRATMLPENKIPGYHCFNMSFSDGQGSEYLLYARYLRERGFAPRLLIVDIKREDFIGPEHPPEVPDFVRTGAAPASIFATYLSLDVLDFSIRTLRGDSPHHRYYDNDFIVNLEVRSKRHRYNPTGPITPMPPPIDVHPERAALYIKLRQEFPMAHAIAYVPPESAWRIAAFSLTGGLDTFLGAIGQIAAAYDELLNFSIPSPITESTQDTYDGSHYSRAANTRVAAALFGKNQDLALDWGRGDTPTVIADYHERLAQFMTTADRAAADPKNNAKE
jgi:hypothetical protein